MSESAQLAWRFVRDWSERAQDGRALTVNRLLKARAPPLFLLVEKRKETENVTRLRYVLCAQSISRELVNPKRGKRERQI